MHSFPCRLIFGFLASLLVGIAAPASAAQVDGLYRAEVGSADLALLVPDGEEAPSSFASRQKRREALMRAALARVLIRLSGTSQVVADPLVRFELIKPVERFVDRYQFLGGGPDPRLRVHFNGRAVREVLWHTGWPVWGAYRPGVVVWVARRGSGGMDLTSPDLEPKLFESLRTTAEQYGLPLLVPLMDGVDRRRLSGRDLLFEDWNRIRTASKRYDPDAVLLLRMDRSGQNPRVEWVLRRNGESRTFSSKGGTLKAALTAGLGRIMAEMARDYAVYPGEAVSMQAAVEGIRDLQEYARVERGLAQLAAIDSVTPIRVEGAQARFRFSFQGPPEGAAHILSLLDLLKPQGQAPAEEEGGEALLHFTFRP